MVTGTVFVCVCVRSGRGGIVHDSFPFLSETLISRNLYTIYTYALTHTHTNTKLYVSHFILFPKLVSQQSSLSVYFLLSLSLSQLFPSLFCIETYFTQRIQTTDKCILTRARPNRVRVRPIIAFLKIINISRKVADECRSLPGRRANHPLHSVVNCSSEEKVTVAVYDSRSFIYNIIWYYIYILYI